MKYRPRREERGHFTTATNGVTAAEPGNEIEAGEVRKEATVIEEPTVAQQCY